MPFDAKISEIDLDYSGSNIVFTQGSEDTWNCNSAKGDQYEIVSIECNDCSHCIELYTPG